MKVLECSSRGDKRFSALYAQVMFGGVYDTIENHYQLSKRFGKIRPTHWKEAKGKFPTHLEVCGIRVNNSDNHKLYKLLWLMYLDKNPKLVAYAKRFDKLNDMFSKEGSVNQAEVIYKYITDREELKKECQELIDLIVFKEKPIRIEGINA